MLIDKLVIKNFLSLRHLELELKPLNVLVGANGSGKSNLLEVVSMLQSMPANLERHLISSGSEVKDWAFNREIEQPISMDIYFNPDVRFNSDRISKGLRHFIQFYIHGNNGIQIEDECIENIKISKSNAKDVFFFYRYNHGAPVISVVAEEATSSKGERHLAREKLELNQSILSQKKDNSFYPEITSLGETYSQLFVNREWQMGLRSEMRMAQPADGETRALSPDGRNLGLILNKQRQNTEFKRRLIKEFANFYPGFYDIESSIEAGMVRIRLQEEALSDGLPASRLSDGTIRFLFLLVVLLNPEPAPLICIEEPEIGLHPDILPTLAKLLVEASERTQLIVTTHSDILLDALTDTPESVLFCDKENGETQMRRASAADIQHYLGQKGLGQTWLDGSLGGKRF